MLLGVAQSNVQDSGLERLNITAGGIFRHLHATIGFPNPTLC